MDLKLDANNQSNIEKFYFIYFLHDLFTGTSAQNYSSGGMLKIPYFGHWIEPNPRYEILFLPDSIQLKDKKPPVDFSRYKSFADIDRVPSLFLADLIADYPRYSHDLCSKFFTFGWCSEREMAFNAILNILEFQCKIKQQGIHTWSEVWLTMIGKNGAKVNVILKVDNTFNILKWRLLNRNIEFEEWINDFGQGSNIKWYNKKSRSKDELNKVKNIVISNKAAEHLKKMVDDWLISKN